MKNNKINKNFLLIIILIIAAFFRFYNLKNVPPGLYPDEAMYGNNAIEAWTTKNFKVFYPENNGREGLFINIQAIFWGLIKKNDPWVLRMMPAIFGFLTVLGIYFLSLELFKKNKNYQSENYENNLNNNCDLKFNEKIALLSSFILATSFWHINFSRIGFRAIMAPFLSVWAFYFLIKSLNENKKNFAIYGGIFFGLGFYTYIAYRVLPLLLIPIFFFYFKKYKTEFKIKNFYIIWIIFLIITFLIALPIGIYYLKNPQDFFGRTSQISIFNSNSPIKDLILNTIKTLGMFNFVGDFNWRHNLSGRPQLDILIGILFLIGIYLLIQNRNKPDLKFINWFLFGWFILAMFPVIISNEGLPHALRAILMIPPIIIISAFGGVNFYEKLINSQIFIQNFNKKNIVLKLFIILLIIVILNSYFNYFVLWAKNKNTYDAFSSNYVELGKYLNSLPKEKLKYIIVEASGVEVRGIPMPAQTVMFITNTFLPENQKEKNIFYVLPQEKEKIPKEALIFEIK
ncbi:MAG: glycosyltransferase family 39 protein [Patescibacteria group bacterium]|nr:glycosyltransferase family 39 protein [Patescibacteria group bacterium]